MGTMTENLAPVALVKELREQTGAPMMDCKRALVESQGEIDAARVWLREKGLARAAQRLERATQEGLVMAAVEGGRGALVALQCETEQIARNEEFAAFAERLLADVLDQGEGAVLAIEHERAELAARLQENVSVSAVRLLATPAGRLVTYVHPPARKLGVLLSLEGGEPGVERDAFDRRLAMQVAASGPRYTSRGEVPEEVVVAERAVYANSDEVLQKPAAAREKIVAGMLGKRLFAEQVLLEQEWIHEAKRTVADALAEAGVAVVEFARLRVGR